MQAAFSIPLDLPGHVINELTCMDINHTKPLFNLSVARCRAAGARGGRRSAEARRQRRPAQPPTLTSISLELKRETAHEASLLLDANFPWLKGAWIRSAGRRTA